MVFGKRAGWLIMLTTTLAMILAVAPNVRAQDGRVRNPPAALRNALLAQPLTADYKLDSRLSEASGRVTVVVHLAESPTLNMGLDQRQRVVQEQQAFIAAMQVLDPSAIFLGHMQMLLNAVIFEMNVSALDDLAADARVTAIKALVDYQLDLSETVPYIGATPEIQAAGFRGRDVRVAVLDSGIDYTHAAFGGVGTVEAYQAAYGSSPTDLRNTTRDSLFPTARVVVGYDFVGEAWPDGPLAPDDDPIDCGVGGLSSGTCAGGHGTHVADIIGGAQGVAPEVSLYAIKVCSAVSTSCSGVALLQGLDFAVDPNGDGDTSDSAQIINMSLGSSYGLNYADSLSLAVDNATSLGVLTVVSAGNSADKPYVVGTPSAARTALAVAQTEVPSARLPLLEIVSPASLAGTLPGVFQPWSVLPTSALEGPLQYGDGAGGNRLGCTPFPAGSLSGRIVLVDRGTCGFSVKISNIADGGGLAGIIGLVTPGDPFAGGFSGGDPTIPGFMISQTNANLLRSGLTEGVTLRFDPANWPSLAGTMVGSSSRGPTLGQMFYGNQVQFGQIIKPEIGAPGASLSAVAGSGSGNEPFGGTSGAAPMVTGAAALLHDATDWQLSPLELKARLMNTGETTIYNTAQATGGSLAAITRIGGGEVRINRAVATQIAAWEQVSRGGAISFGFVDAFKPITSRLRRVVVRNYSDQPLTLNIASSLRFSDDALNGAVSLSTPTSVRVPARGQRTMTVRVNIDSRKLREWALDSGALGASGDALSVFEYDGYLRLEDASGNSANTITMPWQVLPRLSGDVRGPASVRVATPAIYENRGSGAAYLNTYAMIGTSGIEAAPGSGSEISLNDLRAVGYATYDGNGICPTPADGVDNYLLEFAVNTHYRQTHGFTPGQFAIDLDTNRDGVADFALLNADGSLNNITDGRTYSWVVNLRTGAASAFFYGEHQFESANWLLRACAVQFQDTTNPTGALLAPALGQPVNAAVSAYDFYAGNILTDAIKEITFAPGGERYNATITAIPAGSSANLVVTDTGSRTNSSESGVMLYLTANNGSASSGAREGRETLLVTVRE